MHLVIKLKHILLVACLTALVLPGQGEEVRRHSLWRVQSESRTLYLLGSIHLLKPADHPLPEAFDAALNRADALALEVDLGLAESLGAQLKLLARGIFADGQTLDDVLEPETLTLVKTELAALNIEFATVRHFKPWMLLLTMSQTRMIKLGFDPLLGVDWQLYRNARARDLPVYGLESIDYQIDLFDTALSGWEEELVQYTMRELETFESELDRLLDAWRTGDLESLHGILSDSLKDYPELEAALITRRNHNWIPALEKWLAGDRTVLVVVGAGHLGGPDGVIALLENAGYKIDQL